MQVVKVKLEKNKERYYVATDDLVHFVKWLQNPLQSVKIIPIKSKHSLRSESTINTISKYTINIL